MGVRKVMRRGVLVATSVSVVTASLLLTANPASAKIGNLYEDDEVPIVLGAAMDLPAELREEKMVNVQSIDFSLTKEELESLYPAEELKKQIYAPNAEKYRDQHFMNSEDTRRHNAGAISNTADRGEVKFFGVWDKKFKPIAASDGYTGEAERTYSTGHQVTDTTTSSTTHTAGAKVSVSLGIPDLGLGSSVEASYSFSTMSSDSTAVQTSSQDAKVQKIPEKASGWMEGYPNGGYYVGWIAYSDGVTYNSDPDGGWQVMPAKVFFKSEKNTSPVTWVQRGRALPLF
ncbi:hypothetical protein [Streptomyces sp. NPDC086787]|uniref:hypothetical protein n=1 Tax=Streptomyces sp. NPDC086787 TaxID=3365759 RepID=UPI0037FD9D4F